MAAQAPEWVPEILLGCWKGPESGSNCSVSSRPGLPRRPCIMATLLCETPVQTHQTLTEKYRLLRCLLEEKVHGALVWAPFIQLYETLSHKGVFQIFCLGLLDGRLTVDPAELRKEAVLCTQYSALYVCDVLALGELHQGLFPT